MRKSQNQAARYAFVAIEVVAVATVIVGGWNTNWGLMSAGLGLAGTGLGIRKTMLELAPGYQAGLLALEARLNRRPTAKESFSDPALRETELELLAWALLAAAAMMGIRAVA